MKLKVSLIIGIALALCATVVMVLSSRNGSGAKVKLTLRIAVNPAGESAFVVQQANAAKFKYVVGNMSGVKPVFAQKLALKPVPNSDLLEATVGADTEAEARRYAELFMQTLQRQCGTRAHLALREQTIR